MSVFRAVFGAKITSPAEYLAPRLQALRHGDSIIKLTQFAHDSPAIKALRTRIAEAIIQTLEEGGYGIMRDPDVL